MRRVPKNDPDPSLSRFETLWLRQHLVVEAGIARSVSDSGHIRVLELNRPSAHNAISRSLIAALRAELDDLHKQYTPEADEASHTVATSNGATRAVVLASAADACFCAGTEVKERKTFTQKE